MRERVAAKSRGPELNDFLVRLQQRKLIQWAAAYVAFAFALLQGIDIVAQQFAWPESVQRSITLALVLGFFVTLLLAWYHGEQGRQRVSGTELLLIALVLGFGGAFLWRVAGKPPASGRARVATSQSTVTESVAASPASPASATQSIPEKSVAVLPFANDSGDKNERFFSDGLSEDLITALSQFAGLKVINSDSSFKFRDSHDSVSTIAGKLGVARLLQGGVRKLGDEVRIRAELVNAADGRTLWSQHYDRPYKDLFKLQDDITRSVADALKARLLTDHPAQNDRPPSGNLQAYTAYLKSRAHPSTVAGIRRAIALNKEATQIDPDYAQSYAVESTYWMFLAASFVSNEADVRQSIEHARTAADTALRLDPNLAGAHYARAFILLNADLDWQGAHAEADKVVALAPNDSNLWSIKSQVLTALGRTGEAEKIIRKRIASNPLNSGAYLNLALILRMGRLDDAQAALRKAIELAPGDARLHANLALVELLRGDRVAAAKAANAEPPGFWHDFAEAAVLQTGADRAAADVALKRIKQEYADTDAYQLAELYALRKDSDGMFRWLDRAWTNRDPGLQHLLVDPLILRYKDDPRFTAYCRKVGLPVPTLSKTASG